MGIFKIFKKKDHLKSVTLGERDEKGFCSVFVNGEKTDMRMLVFTREESEHLQKVAEQVYKDLENGKVKNNR